MMTDGRNLYHLCPSCGLPHANGRRAYCPGCKRIGTALDVFTLVLFAGILAAVALALAWLLY